MSRKTIGDLLKTNPQITALESRIEYSFKDKAIIARALTHSSYGDGRRTVPDYERMEFLGDRILGMMTAKRLYADNSQREGDMARHLNALVRKEMCAKIARKVGLGDALQISPAEEKQGGREKTSILGDACEALLAAIYLDGGMSAAEQFYDRFWSEDFKRVTQSDGKDPKTELQERATAKGGGQPVYSVIERTGPDHRPLFVIEVSVEKFGSAKGTGKSKKDAERFAAKHLLESWRNDAK